MIQRVQTIWLLLASVCAFLTLKLPFYSGTLLPTEAQGLDTLHVTTLNGQYSILLTIATVIVGTLAALSIFMFKNRGQQMKYAIVGLLLQIGVIAWYFKLMGHFADGNLALSSALSFAVVIFFLMALSGIRKDQKLIKSLDRLR